MNDEEVFFDKGRRYVSNSSDVNKTVCDLVRVAAEAVGSNMGALYLVDRPNGVLRPAVIENLPEAYIAGCGEVPIGQQCCGRAVLHKMPWYIEDIWNSTLFSAEARDSAMRAQVRGCFSIPVVTPANECIGSLSAHFSERHMPSQYEIDRHQLFAQLIAFALVPETTEAKRAALFSQS